MSLSKATPSTGSSAASRHASPAEQIYDPAMVLAAQRGELKAKQALLTQTRRDVAGFLRFRWGEKDEIPDMVQDIALEATRNLGQCDPTKYKAWVRTIARRRICEEWGRVTHNAEVFSGDQWSDAFETAMAPDFKLEFSYIARAFGIDEGGRAKPLTPAQQKRRNEQLQIWVLHDYQGHSTPEIEQLLGMTESEVKKRLTKARERLQKLYAP